MQRKYDVTFFMIIQLILYAVKLKITANYCTGYIHKMNQVRHNLLEMFNAFL